MNEDINENNDSREKAFGEIQRPSHECVCGRKLIKYFEINKKVIMLCPFCAYQIMKQQIKYTYGEKKYDEVLKILNSGGDVELK